MAGGGTFANGALTASFGYLFNEVGLACRTVFDSPSAAHCGLFIFDRNADGSLGTIRHQFSLGGGETEFNTAAGAGTFAADLDTFRSGKGYYKVDVPDGMTPEQFEAKVAAAAAGYSARTYDPIFGPNSNSAVGFAILNAGGTLPYISGWSNYSPLCGSVTQA
jgi:hypothetical protein